MTPKNAQLGTIVWVPLQYVDEAGYPRYFHTPEGWAHWKGRKPSEKSLYKKWGLEGRYIIKTGAKK